MYCQYCYVLLCIAMYCHVLLCIAMHCYVLLCIALYCDVLLCIASITSITIIPWYYDTAIVWCYDTICYHGTMILWCYDMALWYHYSTILFRYYDTLILSCSFTIILLSYGTIIPYFNECYSLWHYCICYFTVTQVCTRTILHLYKCGILLLCSSTNVLLYCSTLYYCIMTIVLTMALYK